jgi:FtsZ-interacting cell division protein YlmF
MDELKKLTRPYDDDDTLIDDGSDLDVDVDVEPSYTRPVTPVQPAQEPVINPMGAAPVNTGMGGYSVNEIPTPITMGGVADSSKYRVVLVKPERFADASTIADHLNAKRTVVLNLESTNKEVSRRLVDFLSGVAYANNGEMKRVAASTYIITPFNVDIVGDLLDELESSGAFLQ